MNSNSYAILGATGGLGSALARRLARAGHRLVLGARRADALAALGEEIGARTIQVDGSDFDGVDEFLEHADDGTLAGVANCAGSLLLKPAHKTSHAEYVETLTANLTTAFATVRAAGRAFASRGGSVVLVSSAAASVGLQNHEAIATAKAGVAGLVRSAAATYAGQGIRVNAVAPGLMETPLTAPLMRSTASRDASLALHPAGRAGDPAEVADLMAWLLAEESSWVTGQVWGIDGGLAELKLRPVTRLAARATRVSGKTENQPT